ncbi:hypothetical protein B9479_004199 [Cryptococcus floricola]|uniref:BTB domain-containing protein n=1 Tax=Cryptococcus floricola TaxID=2591691 RepID=A0A5D3AY46_9TREE|nr:hypothetical protein B9479_004199 [Cryptococcus floricola]
MDDTDYKQDHQQPKSSRKWNDPTVDEALKVVSSDGMTFYVPAYLLKAHSVALREMIKDLSPASSSLTNDSTPASADPSQTIAFTDDTIETSSVITFFLHTISGNRLITSIAGSPTTEYFPMTYHHTMLFAKKWNCPQAMRALELLLYCVTSMGQHNSYFKPLDVFVIAAKHDLPHIAAKVIEVYKSSTGCLERPSGARWGLLPSDADFDLHSIPKEAWEEIPPKYTKALGLLSCADEPTAPTANGNMEKRGAEQLSSC